MKILIAPDKFKDAIDAATAARAIRAGIHGLQLDAECDLCPLADGGDGSGAILAAAWGAHPRTASVHDPLGRTRNATWWYAPDAQVAIVEMAQASGLALLTQAERRATETTSFGTGELIVHAIDAGAHSVQLCAGGSATVDGGAGCLQALGWQLIDASGAPLPQPVCGGMLAQVRELRPPASPPRCAICVLVDVRNPLLGPDGVVPAFAPQKGAHAEDLQLLETGMCRWADVLLRASGVDVSVLAGAGAAGGLPAAHHAALHAKLENGFDAIAAAVGLADRVRACDVVLTGEGRLDRQTSQGKVVGGVAKLARVHAKPVVAFVGDLAEPDAGDQLARELGLAEARVITPPATPLPIALRDAEYNLRNAAADWMRVRLSAGGSA